MEKNSMQTSTRVKKHAVENARLNPDQKLVGVKVKSVKCIGTADVYNMEVENHHNFSVNGGFIVHNCMDAWRYAYYTRHHKTAVVHSIRL